MTSDFLSYDNLAKMVAHYDAVCPDCGDSEKIEMAREILRLRDKLQQIHEASKSES